ncbi:EpsG family protein [Sinimarinibacterium thermocellulolyticum]|uniref:EpsG family protein n=1 Tax=Sinimarinibacterium thermocellulolyticum TaxID=3170016 RepID=A0ABV2A5H3_9GAMM
MTIYFAFLAVLLLAAAAEFTAGQRGLPYQLSLGVTTIFVAGRFETGNDWLSYREIYTSLPGLADLSFSDLVAYSAVLGKEPGYLLLNVVLKTLTSDFYAVTCTCACFQIWSLNRFLKTVTHYRATVLAISVGWLLFSVYFSVIRQGVAIAFFLLFILAWCDGRRWTGLLLALLGTAFHVTVIIYLAIFFLARTVQLKSAWSISFCAAYGWALASIVFDVTLSGLLLQPLTNLPIELIASKITYYIGERSSAGNFSTSSIDVAYVLIASPTIFSILNRMRPGSMSPIEKAMLGFSVIAILWQLLFINETVLRNRVMYVAYTFQFILITHWIASKGLQAKVIYIAAVASVYALFYGMFLGAPYSKTFVPYQSAFGHYVLGEQSTGETRTREVLRDVYK